MTTKSAIILGAFVLVAAIAHAMLTNLLLPARPLHVGHISGSLLTREQNGIAHQKCDGFRVECYETFVVVYVDKSKEPTWTGNYVLTIPWSKIESMTLKPEGGGT